jgi:hypothetical protein
MKQYRRLSAECEAPERYVHELPCNYRFQVFAYSIERWRAIGCATSCKRYYSHTDWVQVRNER